MALRKTIKLETKEVRLISGRNIGEEVSIREYDCYIQLSEVSGAKAEPMAIFQFKEGDRDGAVLREEIIPFSVDPESGLNIFQQIYASAKSTPSLNDAIDC